MKELITTQLTEVVISTLSMVITAVVLPLLTQFILSKTRNDKQKGIVNDIADAVSRTVDFLEVRMTKQFKEDGKWDKETQREVLNFAVEMSIKELSEVTIKNLKLDYVALRERVEKEIEKYIHESKTASTSVNSKNIKSLTGK